MAVGIGKKVVVRALASNSGSSPSAWRSRHTRLGPLSGRLGLRSWTRARQSTSLRRRKVDSAFPYHDGSLSLSGDGKGTPDLVHLPLQVVRDDRMDVDGDDPSMMTILMSQVPTSCWWTRFVSRVTSTVYSLSAAWRRSPLLRSAHLWYWQVVVREVGAHRESTADSRQPHQLVAGENGSQLRESWPFSGVGLRPLSA